MPHRSAVSSVVRNRPLCIKASDAAKLGDVRHSLRVHTTLLQPECYGVYGRDGETYRPQRVIITWPAMKRHTLARHTCRRVCVYVGGGGENVCVFEKAWAGE